MTTPASLKLVNCRACDDIFRPADDRDRACACGKTHCTFRPRDVRLHVSGPCLVLMLRWEDYDGAGPDRGGRWLVLREPHPEIVRTT